MHDEAVRAVEELTIKSMELKQVKDDQYSPVTLHRVYSDPRPEAVGIKSLTGIMDFLESNVDKMDMSRLMLHIVDHTKVKIITDVCGESNKRNTVLVANLDGLDSFPFERFLEQETFIIKLRSMFGTTEDLESIIRYTSKIDDESAIRTEDNGITQNINMKKGLSGVKTERDTVPSLVTLRPYRTFPEAEQPKSEFLFRMKNIEGVVTCALFDADGGAWRNQARLNIAAFFTASEIEIPIIS